MEDSEHAEGTLATALEHFHSGRDQQAADLCRQVLAADPANAKAIHLWGALEARAGRVDAAIEHLQQAIQIHPANPKFHNSLGAAFAQEKRLACAIHHFSQALALEPYYLIAVRNLIKALRELGYTAEANRLLDFVTTLDPETADNPDTLYRLARRHHDAREFRDAIELYRRFIARRPDFIDARKLLVDALWQEQRAEEALAACEELLSIKPDEPEMLKNLGVLLQQKGRVEEAGDAARKALELMPDYAEAYLTLTECNRLAADDPEIKHMEALCEKPSVPPSDKVILHFALGKVYRNSEDYDRAFEHYRLGSAMKRNDVEYNPAEITLRVDIFTRFFDKARFAEIGNRFASHSRLPIFIVGMPRSGTSLVEQIVASHRVVHGAGELNDLRRMMEGMPSLVRPRAPFPACIGSLAPAVGRRLAREYVEKLTALAPDADHVADKMPWNFHMLGMIALFWPHAKIIHCLRDPMDTCVSCFTQYFQTGQPFSWDLAELGRYYRDYERLAEHWRAVLPLEVLEVKYEQLVTEQERVTRDILGFCGLDWDDRCLTFYETDRPLKTNPLALRRPMYASAIGRWRHFEPYVEPLRRALAGRDDPS